MQRYVTKYTLQIRTIQDLFNTFIRIRIWIHVTVTSTCVCIHDLHVYDIHRKHNNNETELHSFVYVYDMCSKHMSFMWLTLHSLGYGKYMSTRNVVFHSPTWRALCYINKIITKHGISNIVIGSRFKIHNRYYRSRSLSHSKYIISKDEFASNLNFLATPL